MATVETMSIEERYKYPRLMQPRYRQADRETKQRLLDEMEAFTGLHRKSQIRRLKDQLTREPRTRTRSELWGGGRRGIGGDLGSAGLRMRGAAAAESGEYR